MSSISARYLFVHDVWGLSEDMIMGSEYLEDEEEYPELFFGPESDALGNDGLGHAPISWRDTPGVLAEHHGQLEHIDYSANYVLDLYFEKLLVELTDKKALSLARTLYAEATSKHSGIFFFDDDPELDFSEIIDAVDAFNEPIPFVLKREPPT